MTIIIGSSSSSLTTYATGIGGALREITFLRRAAIYGYQADSPKSVKVKSVSGGESELESTLHSDTKTLVIKRPGISLSDDGWSISIQ